MGVPPKKDPRWTDIVTGKKTYTLKFLAAKILLGRLVRSVKDDSSPGNISAAVDQLHAIFTKNAESPSVKDDLKTIFN